MMDVCDLCNHEVVEVDGQWVHADAAQGAFCGLVLAAAGKVKGDGNE